MSLIHITKLFVNVVFLTSATSIKKTNMLFHISSQLMFSYWLPLFVMPIWWIDMEKHAFLSAFFWLLHMVAWVIICLATLSMDFFEFVGIKQVGFRVPQVACIVVISILT